MKIRLNKQVLDQMPAQVRELVVEWKNTYHRIFISVETVPQFYAEENARVTMINLVTGAEASAQAAGDFAGWTKLSPGQAIPLPPGVVAVEKGFFCGVPFLTIHQGSNPQLNA
jgi:hypothetical protein